MGFQLKFRTLLKNGILLSVQDPPEKWDFTFCSGPSWKMEFCFLFRTLQENGILLLFRTLLKNGILLAIQDPPEKIGPYFLFRTLLFRTLLENGTTLSKMKYYFIIILVWDNFRSSFNFVFQEPAWRTGWWNSKSEARVENRVKKWKSSNKVIKYQVRSPPGE